MPQPPAGFITIGSGIYISLAPISSTAVLQPNDSAPNVILIFGWMGASTRHLQHYSQKYAEMYPHATQIIIKCAPSFFWTSERVQRKRLMPVVQALESLGCISTAIQDPTRVRPRLLMHSFSNGGGSQLTTLANLLSSKYPSISTSGHLMSALILDSSPSTGDFRSIGMAFCIAIKNPIIRYIVLAILYFMHAFGITLHALFGVKTMMMRYTEALLRPRLLPWMNSRTPRLYIFSRKDELVPWQEVTRHVEAAKTRGLNVCCEVYEESAHVAHMRLDPKRYWASIQEIWEVALREEAQLQGDKAT